MTTGRNRESPAQRAQMGLQSHSLLATMMMTDEYETSMEWMAGEIRNTWRKPHFSAICLPQTPNALPWDWTRPSAAKNQLLTNHSAMLQTGSAANFCSCVPLHTLPDPLWFHPKPQQLWILRARCTEHQLPLDTNNSKCTELISNVPFSHNSSSLCQL